MEREPARTVLGELDERLNIEFVRVSPEHSIATMPVAGNRQITGAMHGGAFCALAETLASLSACEHAGPGRIAFGLDLSATHTAAAGTAVQLGNQRSAGPQRHVKTWLRAPHRDVGV